MNARQLALALSCLAWVSLSGSSVAQSAPPNDSCATPTALGGPGFYPLDATLATTGTQGQLEPLCLFFAQTAIAKDLWFTYTPSTNGTIRLTTCGLLLPPPISIDDSKLAVYAGAGCPSVGSAIACNDDDNLCSSPGGFNSTVEFTGTCGVTYTFQIGKYPGAELGAVAGQFSVSESGGTPCNVSYVAYCVGDGTNGACPCGNESTVGAGEGCRNSSGSGARMSASGTPSVSADTVTLNLTNLPIPPTIPSSVLYFQGTTQTSAPFADGRLCVGGSMVRLAIKPFGGSTSSYPSLFDLSLSVKGLLPVGGGTRFYQAWYRDVALPCGTRSNLTNALAVFWTP